MKNFKIVMILVAAVAMFCSCGDPEAPTVSVTGDVNEYDLANAEQPIVLTVKATAPKGIENVYGDVWGIAGNDTTSIGQLTIEDFTAGDSYNGTIKYTMKKEAVKNYEKVLFQVVAVTKKDVEEAGHFEVAIKAVTTFTWERVNGANGTGLAEFGLEWKSNAKSPFAIIKPVTGAKLYILQAADYAATSLSAITFPAEAEMYNNVDVNLASKDYNDVIATVYNNKTYVINVKHCDVASTSAKQTITGNYKTFDGTPAAATTK